MARNKDELASPSRRRFIGAGAALGGAFTIGFAAPMRNALAADAPPRANWLSLSADGTIRLVTAKSEMGQGIFTAWATVVAEELEVEPRSIEIVPAPAGAAYRDPMLGKQATFGSTGIAAFFDTLAEAAAAMRTSLLAAAARRWNVDQAECSAAGGHIVHAATARKLSYGALAAEAAERPVEKAAAKPRDAAKLVGQPVPRIEARSKVDGSARFGLDMTLPGAKTALLVRPPHIGSRLKAFDAASIKSIRGVVGVYETSAGVAIVADGFWPAQQAKRALKVEWIAPETPHPSSDALLSRYRAKLNDDGVIVVKSGAAAETVEKSASAVSAVYEAPFLAHAPMEPLNCTAHFKDGDLHIWTGTQDQEATLDAAQAASGVPRDRIHVNTLLLGGGFGRRAATDFVVPTVELAMRVKHPVKLVFERADDIQGGYYRPAAVVRLDAVLDDNRRIAACRVKAVSSSVMANFMGQHQKNTYGEFDFFAVQGLTNPAYKIRERETRWVRDETGIKAWVWRGVGLSQNVFFLESFMDELAAACRMDPVAFRLAQLDGDARARKVLELAAEKAEWGGGLPPGRARGVALHAHGGVYIALVAEISVENGRPRVHRATAAVDCGRVVNPGMVRAQMEGGVIMGLSAALSDGITIQDGAVAQSNFHDYRLLRIDEAPAVDVHIVEGSSRVTGFGEFTTTTIAPAVANALFALKGERVRKFPLLAASGTQSR